MRGHVTASTAGEAGQHRAARRGWGGVAGEEGYSLAELLVVLVILGIILGGLTDLFVSGSHSETDQANRAAAQQDARLALDHLRREIHCSSGLSSSSATSITATLQGYCFPTSLSSAVPSLPQSTINVASTARFPSGTNTISFGSSGSSGTVTCTATTGTSFTGCTGGTGGPYPSGTQVTSTVAQSVTWCSTGGSAPYALKRYVGASCSVGTGVTWVSSLVSPSVFTTSVLPAASPVVASSGGRLALGIYSYDVTAILSNGVEVPGTVTSPVTVSTAPPNQITLSWSAYMPSGGLTVTSYNVYGRDSSGLRLIGNTATSPYVDLGPTTLSTNLTVPPSGTYTVGVGSTSGFNSAANTIVFGASGPVSCTGTTATSFTGCSNGTAGTYSSGTPVTSYSTRRPPPVTLSVSMTVDQTPATTSQQFILKDDIVLRNSRPF